jgi:hypothetical protein
MPDRDEPPPVEPGTATFRRLCDAERFLDRLETAAVVEATVEVVGESAFVVQWRV